MNRNILYALVGALIVVTGVLGYKVYKEVCANCHSARFVKFRNLSEGGIFNEEQVQALAEARVLGCHGRAIVDGRTPVTVRHQRPATSGSSGLRVRKTWSGSPFSTISRYSSDASSSSSWVP